MRKREPRPDKPKRKTSGQRPFEPTAKQRQTVEVLVAAGIAQTQICALLEIGAVTFRKYFQREIDTATTKVNAMVITAHLSKIKDGDFAAIKWWEQARLKWSERLIVGEPDSAADLDGMSDDDLKARIARLRRTSAVVRALDKDEP